MLFNEEQILLHGLDLMHISYERKSMKSRLIQFHKHFGSSPMDIKDIWNDIVGHNLCSEKEKSMKGFQMYLAAHYFLWEYPKNASSLASRFQICERYARGEPLWK